MKLMPRALLAVALGAALLPFAPAPAQAAPNAPAAVTAAPVIKIRAVAPDGTPLDNVRWNVFKKDPATGQWDQGLQMGPLLTAANGVIGVDGAGWTDNQATGGESYKVCLYDDDYQYNQRTVRYADRCWQNATSLDSATVWTPTATQNTLDGSITLPSAGSSLTPGSPWVDGAAKTGVQLTVRPGQWAPEGVALTYQWLTYDDLGRRVPIAGATGTTYTPTAALSGKRLGVEVTGTRSGYRTATASAYLGEIDGSTPTMTGTLKIVGTQLPGNTLTVNRSEMTFSPAGTVPMATWYVNGRRASETYDLANSTLDVTTAMAGADVEVRMSVYNWDCCKSTLYASARGKIGGGVTSAKPTVAGSPVVGQTLTATPGTWGPSGVSLAYQWLRDGAPIANATGATYALVEADRAKRISVRVTGTLAGGYPPVAQTSDPTAAVQGVLAAGTPTISGEAVVGKVLTAVPGTWTPAPAYSYEWFAAGTKITGATGSTYQLVAADRGKAITVKVTGTLSGYQSASKTSAPTAAVQGVLVAGTPTISGEAVVGKVLTAAPGTWTPAPAYSYEWFAGTTKITGATGSTYQLVAGDRGKAIKVQVTGTLSGYQSATKASAPTAAVQGVLVAGTPTISGEAVVGKVLTVAPGTWSPAPAYSYEWFANGTKIAGATGQAYALTDAEAGKAITVKVTGTLSGYQSASKTSAPTAAVKGVLAAPAPAVAGQPVVGRTLTAETGAWTEGTELSYRWLANGTPIAGATERTFAPTAAEVGKTITVEVTGTLAGYQDVTRTSEPTAAVLDVFATAPAPKIAGTALVGRTLTATAGTWSPTPALAHQWLRNGAVISGATGTSYRLTAADAGKRITVRVTATKAGYETTVRTSAATAAVTGTFTSTPTPKVAGIAKVGKKLKAKAGTWAPSATLRYQWLRNGKVIKGATKASYKLGKADRGKRISVRVTGSRSGYLTVVKTSAKTKKVAR